MNNNENFKSYGLNVGRNFLGDGVLYFSDADELLDSVGFLLEEHSCDNCAIFIHSYNGNMTAAIKSDKEEGYMDLLIVENTDLNYFGKIDASYRLCCYGLIIETWPGVFKIINE